MTTSERTAHRRLAAFLAAAVLLVFVGGALPKAVHATHAMDGMMEECALVPCAADLPVSFCVSHCLAAAQADHGAPAVLAAVASDMHVTAAVATAVPVPPSLSRPSVPPASVPGGLRDVSTLVLRE